MRVIGVPSPASHEALDVSSVAGLRRSLHQSLKSGHAAWIRLDGLPVDDSSTHSALCHALVRVGMGAVTGRMVPQIAVLDWSLVDTCSAEGLAFFAVLHGHLTTAGIQLIVCAPASKTVSLLLEQSGVHAYCGGGTWVPSTPARGVSCECVASAALFGPEANESVDKFCDDLSDTIKRLAVGRGPARAVTGTTYELLHNVLSHANAGHAAAAAILFSRKRPPVLQVGVADDGIGIAGAVLSHPRHEWLQSFHDASVTETVLNQTLSGRTTTLDSGTGGGVARIIKRLLRETTATVMFRSGAAMVTLRSTAPDRFEKTALTYGSGTQVRLELRLT